MTNRATIRQREYRKETNYAVDLIFRRSLHNIIYKCYYNALRRVNGKLKPHLYKNLPIMKYEDYYTWSINNSTLRVIYDIWTQFNYSRKLTPSLDRIDSSKGYVLDNLQWVTFSENCSRGRKGKKHNIIRSKYGNK